MSSLPFRWITTVFFTAALLLAPVAALAGPSATEPPQSESSAEPSPATQGGGTTNSQATMHPATATGNEDGVRPFQTWMEDSAVIEGIGLEPVFTLSDYGSVDGWKLGAQAAFEAAPHFEAGARWTVDHLDWDAPGHDSQTGLSDLRGYARYQFRPTNPQIGAGAWVDLPLGADEVGAGNFNVDLFGALRYRLRFGLVLLANLGLESVEHGEDRDTGLHLGGGGIYPFAKDFNVLAELDWRSASDWGMFSLGLDYGLTSENHLRAALGFGFDDRAPDLTLLLGFLIGID